MLMADNKKPLILKDSQRIDVKLKHQVERLIEEEQVRGHIPFPAPFSEKEIDDMKADYDRTINKADNERRLLNAARSTVFIGSFGIPAVMGGFINTGSSIIDGTGWAGLFIIGTVVASQLSNEFRGRQLRDVAVAEYAEKKLSDLSNKHFQQSHGIRMHKELIEHLNEAINFDSFKRDKLQKASFYSLAGLGFVFTINALSLINSPEEPDIVKELQETITNAIEQYFEENSAPSEVNNPTNAPNP